MISKLMTLLWYLRQPKYYKQLFVLVKQFFTNNEKENTRDKSVAWCEKNALSTYELLLKFRITDVIDFEKQFYDEYSTGLELSKNTPIKMGGPGNLTLLYYLAKKNNVKRVIETGVAYGWSSLAILKAMENSKEALLISTDLPYAKLNNEDIVGLVVPEELRANWKVIRLPDVSGLPLALNEFSAIDMCHYDSDKSYQGRMWAYPMLWKKITSGGLFISDDIGDNIAFKEFAENVGVDPFVVKMKNQYVGVLVKP